MAKRKKVKKGHWEWCGVTPSELIDSAKMRMTKEEKVADELADGKLSDRAARKALDRAINEPGMMENMKNDEDPLTREAAAAIAVKVFQYTGFWKVK